METTNLTAFKANKIRPTKDGLKDSKRTGEDCTMLIGITNPYAFEVNESQGYNIKILKDRFRVLEIVLARKGRANGLCPLYFDGAINLYSELPLPNSPEMQNIYEYIQGKEVKESDNTSVSLLSYGIKSSKESFWQDKLNIFASLFRSKIKRNKNEE